MQTEMQQHNYYSRQQCMIVVTYVNCHLLEYTTDIDLSICDVTLLCSPTLLS